MKKTIAILLSLGVLIIGCKQRGSNIVVKGELKNAVSSYIYLQELTTQNNGHADSILLDKSGEFKFKKRILYPTFFALRIGHTKSVTLIAMPKERIMITGSASNLFKTYKVEGSEESKRVQILNSMLAICLEKRDSLNLVLQQFKDNPNIVNIRKTLSMNFQNYIDDQRQFTQAFIDKWPSSLASLYALYQQVDENSFVLYKDEDYKYFAKVDSILYRSYPEAPYVKALHSNVEQMMEQQRALKLKSLLSAMGAKAPEIALPSPKGDTIRLSSTKGKAVLLNFWASWSKPSREENAKLMNLYKKYKYKGFEIFQVSLDKSKDAWVKAIKDDGLKYWINVSDLKYMQSPVVSLYNFDQVPTSFLIDKDGTLMSKNLSDIDLENKLIELLGDKSDSANQ
jgi:peroxiredoxin